MFRALALVLLLPACSADLPAAADTGDGTGLDAVQQEFLDAHNAVRADHGVAPLAYDLEVEASALGWAVALADDRCSFEHENQNTYGENLWWSSWDPSPTEVVEGWASEEAYYDYDANTCRRNQQCGHYTQVVWADSELVGCGKGECSDGSFIWACRYDPPGNWVGERPY